MSNRILIVDDAPFMRMMMKSILADAGYAIAGEAADGAAAVKAWKEQKPDLTVMDITMPEMDGMEAAKRIRQEDPSAKIILCSAIGDQELVVEAMKAGASDFILKPIQKSSLITAVKNALR